MCSRAASRTTPRRCLDELCLSGEVMWGRLSPHPAFESGASARSDRLGEVPEPRRVRRRVRPTRVAPVTIFLREDASWLVPVDTASDSVSAVLSHAGRAVLKQLRAHGASFLRDLVANERPD